MNRRVFLGLSGAALAVTAAAAGIALINSWGNLAGFVSPYLMGFLKDTTHSTTIGMYVMASALFLGAQRAQFDQESFRRHTRTAREGELTPIFDGLRQQAHSSRGTPGAGSCTRVPGIAAAKVSFIHARAGGSPCVRTMSFGARALAKSRSSSRSA